MKPRSIGLGLLLLSVGLAGCNTSGGGSGGGGAPAAAPAATGTVVAQADMPVFCQNAAAAQYNVPLEDITTQTPVNRSFGLLIQGSVDSGSNVFGFDCRFDPTGAYLGLIAQ